jgi:hypothetical protein
MRTILIITAFALLGPTASLGQDMELIKPGPLGRPSLVRDEGEGGGRWASAISVYSDPSVELFVSENLTLGGVYWDGPQYKRGGTYATYVYTFYKTDHECRAHRIPAGHENDPKWLQACAELRYNRRLVVVDTRNKTITIRQEILMGSDAFPHPELAHNSDTTIPLNETVNTALFRAVNLVTKMLEGELRRHPEL